MIFWSEKSKGRFGNPTCLFTKQASTVEPCEEYPFIIIISAKHIQFNLKTMPEIKGSLKQKESLLNI